MNSNPHNLTKGIRVRDRSSLQDGLGTVTQVTEFPSKTFITVKWDISPYARDTLEATDVNPA